LNVADRAENPGPQLIVKRNRHRSTNIIDNALVDPALIFLLDQQAVNGNLGDVSFIWSSVVWTKTVLHIDGRQASVRLYDSIRLAGNAIAIGMQDDLLHAGQLFPSLDCIDVNHLPLCQSGILERLTRAGAGPGSPENERQQN
jgi:hypothetical protein